MKRLRKYLEPLKVAPVRERGLKSPALLLPRGESRVAPVRERGLKSLLLDYMERVVPVAPVRERGLKLLLIMHSYLMLLSLP